MYTRKSQIRLSVVHDATPCTNFATAHMPIIFIDYGNPRKFFREDLCDALTTKVFCLETFMVYGITSCTSPIYIRSYDFDKCR